MLQLLKERGLTFSAAESCTGGLIAKRITDLSGASAVFKDGTVTCYGLGHRLPVKVRPLMITNDEGNRAIFFPKAKMAGSLAWSDGLWKLHIVATAEFINAAALKTCMILSSTTSVDYADGVITAAVLDGGE